MRKSCIANLPPAISSLGKALNAMERYEQKNRPSFRKDDTFATTTLQSSQQTRTQPKAKAGHSDVAHRSRVDEPPASSTFFSASKTRKRVKNASGSESDDELRMTPELPIRPSQSQPLAKVLKESTDTTRSGSRKKAKSKSQSLSQKFDADLSNSLPKRTPAAFPMDINTLGSGPPIRKDEAAEYLSAFLSSQQEMPRSAPGGNQKNDETNFSKSASKPLANTKAVNGSKKRTKSARVIITDDENVQSSDEETKTKQKSRNISKKLEPKPFPMDLSTIPSSSSSSLPVRRKSSSLSTASTASIEQPSTRSPRSNSDPMDYSSESDEGVQYSKSYTQRIKEYDVDPKKLCPFCDARLPDEPSDILLKMLEDIKPRTTPDPRWANALGLKADMSIYVSYCARHVAESKEFPKGPKYGWPTTLKANALANRIKNLEGTLQRIINDPGEGYFFNPLAEAAFKWGKGAITGAKGSWATFDTASTGYYGEQGLAVFTQVLFDLFSDLPEDKIYPLDPNTYRSLVLVPETALLLIQEDLQKKHGSDQDITRTLALKVLRKSHNYGLAMFPVGDGESFVAGDSLARNRARKNKVIVETSPPKREEGKEVKINRAKQILVREAVELSSSDDDAGKAGSIKAGTKRPKIESSAKSVPVTKTVTENKENSAERVKRKKIKLNDIQPTFKLHVDSKIRTENFDWLTNS